MALHFIAARGQAPVELPTHPHPAELAALLLGAKPVLFANITPFNAGFLSGAAKEVFKLRVLQCRRRTKGSPDARYVMLGRDLRALRRAQDAWLEDPMGADWGRALGYPACCVAAYGSSQRAADKDVVRAAARRTRAYKPRSWLLNNVYNFYSRLRDGDQVAEREFTRRNAALGLFTGNLRVAYWHPCAYDCADSLRIASDIAAFLRRRVPGAVEQVEPALARPYLYWGDFAMAGLEARRDRDVLEVRGVSLPRYSRAPAEQLEALSRGGRLRQRDGSLSLGKTALAGALLLDFGARGKS